MATMQEVENKGWTVTFAGTGINLALGVLYAWSVVKAGISAEVAAGNWNWAAATLNDPYSVALVVFAFAMVPGGRMLDKLGPRLTSSLGGLLVGIGFVMVAMSNQYWVWIVGFGVFAGSGIGLAYASATPAAVKWFPAHKTGLIAGLVVAGFGLASAYIAPLASFMQKGLGISQTMLYLGIAFMIVVIILSQFLANPPAGFSSAKTPSVDGKKATPSLTTDKKDYTWKEMMGTGTFWLLWAIYAIGAGAGLMVIGFASSMAKISLLDMAWIAVTVLAVGNATGRIFAGILSDKIGRKASLMIFLSLQAITIFSLMFISKDSVLATLLVATFIGFNYGTNLTLFPTATKDFFGLKSFGLNYGIVFTAWGVGGAILSRVSEMLATTEGLAQKDYTNSCVMAGCLLLLGVVLTVFVKPPRLSEKTPIDIVIEQPAEG